jgi:type IV pilus assembly protein PilN
MELNLDLATRPYVDLDLVIKRLRVAMIVIAPLIATLGVMLYFAHVTQNSYRADVEALDSSISANLKELAGYRRVVQGPEATLLVERTSALNQLFDDKAFSWTLLMHDLERTVPPEVELSSIQPERSKDATITLHVHVHGPRAGVIEFLQNLEHSSSFDAPRILEEYAQDDSRSSEHSAAFSDSSIEEFTLVCGYNSSDLQQEEHASTLVSEGPNCTACPKSPVASTVLRALPPTAEPSRIK